MASRDQVDRIKADVGDWNRWRKESFDIVDLSGVNLIGVDLRGANFGRTHIVSPDYDVDEDGRLTKIFNIRADLSRTDLSNSNLSGADLTGADLSHANLSGANLSGVDFDGAIFNRTILNAVDLSNSSGLDKTVHFGPSSIGIDAIYTSTGKIPATFLQGVGVPEHFITYIKSLTRTPNQYFSCFISYSFADQEFAERLYIDLQANGVRCWFAGHDMRAGKKIIDQIDDAIRLHERVLLVLSESSMSKEWVHTEIRKARKREVRESKQIIFPIGLVGFDTIRDWELFDSEIGKDSAVEIREYFIPDFSRWKDRVSYEKAFQKLLGDLKADTHK